MVEKKYKFPNDFTMSVVFYVFFKGDTSQNRVALE